MHGSRTSKRLGYKQRCAEKWETSEPQSCKKKRKKEKNATSIRVTPFPQGPWRTLPQVYSKREKNSAESPPPKQKPFLTGYTLELFRFELFEWTNGRDPQTQDDRDLGVTNELRF